VCTLVACLCWFCAQVDLVGSSFDTLLGLHLHTGDGFGIQLGSNDDCNGLASCLSVPVPSESTSRQLRAQVRACVGAVVGATGACLCVFVCCVLFWVCAGCARCLCVEDCDWGGGRGSIGAVGVWLLQCVGRCAACGCRTRLCGGVW
jgi:hypothetical protein